MKIIVEIPRELQATQCPTGGFSFKYTDKLCENDCHIYFDDEGIEYLIKHLLWLKGENNWQEVELHTEDRSGQEELSSYPVSAGKIFSLLRLTKIPSTIEEIWSERYSKITNATSFVTPPKVD